MLGYEKGIMAVIALGFEFFPYKSKIPITDIRVQILGSKYAFCHTFQSPRWANAACTTNIMTVRSFKTSANLLRLQ